MSYSSQADKYAFQNGWIQPSRKIEQEPERLKIAQDLERATQKKKKQQQEKPATTNAGFRRLEAQQTAHIANENVASGYENPFVNRAAKVADTVINRPGYAFRNAIIQQDRDVKDHGYLYQWTPEGLKSSGRAFMKGLRGEERPTGEDLLREEVTDLNLNSLGGKAATFAADIATNPVNFIAPGAGIMLRSAIVPKVVYGAGLGSTFSGLSAFGEQRPAEEVMDAAAAGALFGGTLTAGGAMVPKAVKDISKYTKQAINESKPGELLNWRNVKGMEVDSAKLRAQDMASVLMQELNKIPARKDFNPAEVPIQKGISGDDLSPVQPKEADNFDFLMDDAGDFSFALDDAAKIKPDFTVEPTGRTHVGEQQPELPAGNIPLALPEGRTRFQATPDGKVMDVQNGSYPLAKVEGVDYAADTSLGNRQRIAQDIDQPIPRSDVGDPAYLKELEGKYNELVNAEVNRLKGQVQGVVKYMPGEDAPLLRSSMNAKWYRDFYAKNGRPPHEGEYRDMAINNLARGVEDDFEGVIAPNQEFLSTLSELSRGQKLPEEWHGLQQSVRELEGAKADQDIPVTADSVKVGDTVYNQSGEPLKVLSIVNKNTMRVMDPNGIRAPIKFSEVRAENKEIDPLVNEMKTEQAKVEPFGLNRDMSRLSEIENAFRNKTGMKDQADFRDYEAVNFKAEAAPNREYAPTFYSQLQRTIEQKMPNKAVPHQILNIIKSGNVKQDEIKWSGIEDWLSEQKTRISKDDVLAYLRDNDVQVEEVTKGGSPYSLDGINNNTRFRVDNDIDTWSAKEIIESANELAEGIEEQGSFTDIVKAVEYLREHGSDIQVEGQKNTQYEQYQLPGGESYRELLFTMPGKESKFKANESIELTDGRKAVYLKESDNFQGKTEIMLDGKHVMVESNSIVPRNGQTPYHSAHWSEPNVLAHVRFNERTGPNGEKILHVEEVQSDWHQEGRRKGYQNDVDINAAKSFEKALREKYGLSVYETIIGNNKVPYEEQLQLSGLNIKKGNAVPDAPFKTTWPEMVMKRMIRYAAENGYDRLTWTTGEQQAARYDLSKYIGHIRYRKIADGAYDISARDKRGTFLDNLPLPRQADVSQIESVFGKEVAQKIIDEAGEKAPNGDMILSGLDLQVGGEGMKGFYDKMIPTWLNKYAKNWEARIEEISLGKVTPPFTVEEVGASGGEYTIFKDGEPWEYTKDISTNRTEKQTLVDELNADYKNKDVAVHSIPITESMRESVLYEGQPKFKLNAEVDKDLKVLRDAFEKRKFGIFGGKTKVDLAPEALERPEYQAAGVIADKLGLRLVPFKGNGTRGAQKGRTIYVNEKLEDPLDYIFWHEVGHSMKNTHFDHYLNLLEISLDHVENGKAIRKHYLKQDYKEIEVPDEFAADIFAEALSTPGFFAKVADKAPDLLKPLLEAVSRMVDNIKGMISKDDSLVPYLKDVEGLRERIKQEVAMPYFKDAMGEKEFAKTFGDSWAEPAAKVKSVTSFKLSQQNPLDDIKAMVEHGAEIIGKGGLDFAKALEERFPEQLAGYSPEMKTKMINTVFTNAKKLNDTGSVEIKMGQNSMTVKKPAQKSIITQTIEGDEPKIETQPSAERADVPNNDGVLSGIDIEPEDLKDISGRQAGWRDIWRNMRDVFGDKYEAVKARVLDPLEDAKASWIDHQRELTDELESYVVDGLGIAKDSKDSELVQLYGEGGYHFFKPAPKNALEGKNTELVKARFLSVLEKQYGKDNVNWTGDGAEILQPFAYNDLVKEVGAKRAADIVYAENWFREKYDQLIDQVNQVRQQIYPGQDDKLVPKRKDYFRHFREMEGIEGIMNLFDNSAQISPGLAGKSMYTRPKTKFAGFMQQRGMGKYKPDAVGGFLEYIPSSTYAIHMDPQGAVFRKLEKELVDTMGENHGINKFLEYLKYYADDIQGKTNFFDRSAQFLTDRRLFKALDWMNSRIKSNMVLGNAGTMVSQVFNIPQGLAFTKQYSGPGLTRYISSAVERYKNPVAFADSNPMAQSRFLKERYSGDIYRKFDIKISEKAKNVAIVAMEDVDRFATEFIWNSCYEKALNTKGIGDPIRYADVNTRRLVAGRGVGEVPLMQKSKLIQMIAPFQVEVGNLMNVMGDMRVEKDWGAFVILPIALWLFNRGAEKIKGSSVAFDPLQAIIDAGKMAQDDQDKKAYRMAGRLAGEFLSNIPLGQTLAASLFDDETRKEFFGREDPTRFGSGILVAKGLKDPIFKMAFPYGGMQIEKTLKGAAALSEGGIYTDDGKLKYPVSRDILNAGSGIVFGPGGFRETDDYYANNRRPLSEKQTGDYKMQVEGGMDAQEAYDSFMTDRRLRAINIKMNKVLKDESLTPEKRDMELERLQREYQEVLVGQ